MFTLSNFLLLIAIIALIGQKIYDDRQKSIEAHEKEKLKSQISELSNPLEPFKINLIFTYDFSGYPTNNSEVLEAFRNYLSGLGDRKSLNELRSQKKMPFLFSVYYKGESESGEIETILYPEHNYTSNPFKDESYFNPVFSDNEGKTINTIIPDIYLTFNRVQKKLTNDCMNQSPHNSSDVVYCINSQMTYDRAPIKKLYYRISFKDKKILFNLTVDQPVCLKSNRDLKSIYSCKEGNMTLGFHLLEGAKVEIISLRLIQGLDNNIITQFKFEKDQTNKFNIPFYTDSTLNEVYYFTKGENFVVQ